MGRDSPPSHRPLHNVRFCIVCVRVCNVYRAESGVDAALHFVFPQGQTMALDFFSNFFIFC